MSEYQWYQVIVVRDATLHIPRQVSAWELVILQEVFGEGNVEIKQEFHRPFEAPDVEIERSRLERLYGVEDQTKIPYVDVAYGRGPSGLKALSRAIAQAKLSEAEVKAADKAEADEDTAAAEKATKAKKA